MRTTAPISVRNVPNEELLADLHRAAAAHTGRHLSFAAYQTLGRYSPDGIMTRFKTWNLALAKAHLRIGKPRYWSTLSLYQKMEHMWKSLNRQPQTYDYLKIANSPSYATYVQRFGSWHKALQAFITWANSRPNTSARKYTYTPPPKIHSRRHRQKPSARLRYQVLRRDNFRCVQCGRSPANQPGVILHLDHIHPWSAGGETTYENLQTLCEQCNLGKFNLAARHLH